MENLWKLISIQKTKATPYSRNLNGQVEVVNKHAAKYLGDFVSSDTLDWGVLIPAMAFAYNTTLHRTTMNTSFFLIHILDHRTIFFDSTPDYSDNFASELTGRMKIAREMANKHLPMNWTTTKKQSTISTRNGITCC